MAPVADHGVEGVDGPIADRTRQSPGERSRTTARRNCPKRFPPTTEWSRPAAPRRPAGSGPGCRASAGPRGRPAGPGLDRAPHTLGGGPQLTQSKRRLEQPHHRNQAQQSGQFPAETLSPGATPTQKATTPKVRIVPKRNCRHQPAAGANRSKAEIRVPMPTTGCSDRGYSPTSQSRSRRSRQDAERGERGLVHHAPASVTPAASKVAISPRMRRAASTRPMARTAPVPSPSRRCRSKSGCNFRCSSTTA